MIRGGLGGGNTQTGIHFEGRVDIVTYLNNEVAGYRCEQKPLNEIGLPVPNIEVV